MNNTFFSYSFGCRVNHAEKQAMDSSLIEKGLLFSSVNPDFYIINSCAVTGKAEREVKQHIYQTRKKFPQTIIILTGCAATNWMKSSIKINDVDYIFNNQNKETIVLLIINLLKIKKNKFKTQYFPIGDKFINAGRVFVKIQDGCLRFCSYCIVPHLRNPVSSRTIKAIVNQINSQNKPANEIILTAVNTEYFGLGTKETLPQLLDAILNKTQIKRVSMGSIHPWSLTTELINWYRDNAFNPRLVKFFHIPIQSGSALMLKLMKRKYDIKDLLDKMYLIKSIYPDTFIGTDIITGFYGESDKIFTDSLNFLKKAPIDRLHIFRFSHKNGTYADKLKDNNLNVSPEEKIYRSKILHNLNRQKYQSFIKSLIGKSYNTLLFPILKNKYQEGLLINQIPVFIKRNEMENNSFKNVIVNKITKNMVIGEITYQRK